LAEQAADYVRRDPVKGVGIAVASGVAMRMAIGLAGRLLWRRLPSRRASRAGLLRWR
jgi:ElaB/YqjD/DUF883 family membrane-anchored ribosome-binding protein